MKMKYDLEEVQTGTVTHYHVTAGGKLVGHVMPSVTKKGEWVAHNSKSEMKGTFSSKEEAAESLL